MDEQYKRQTLNIFSIIHRYLTIKNASAAEKKKIQPWTYIFAGKAAPGEKTLAIVDR
jgi:starch phosphorylase